MAPKGNQKRAKGPTLEDLQALAEEMNEVMGLDPAIEFDDETDIEDLKIEILNNCYDDDDNCEIYTTDEFSDESWATLKKLSVDPADPEQEPEQEPEPEPETKKKPGAGKKADPAAGKKTPSKKEPEPEPDPDDEPSLEDDIAVVEDSDDIEEIKDIAKDHGIRIPPPFLKNIDKLKEYVGGKLGDKLEEQGGGSDPEPEPETKPAGRGNRRGAQKEEESTQPSPSSAKKDPRRGNKKTEPEKKTGGAKKSDAAKSRYTRATAWAEAVAELDGPIGLNELAERADEIYCEKTGREDASNIREAKWLQTHGINILTGLGLAEVVDDQFDYKG